MPPAAAASLRNSGPADGDRYKSRKVKLAPATELVEERRYRLRGAAQQSFADAPSFLPGAGIFHNNVGTLQHFDDLDVQAQALFFASDSKMQGVSLFLRVEPLVQIARRLGSLSITSSMWSIGAYRGGLTDRA